MISTRIVIPAATLVLGLALGLGLGWKLYRPKPAPVETAAPAVRQKDQSLVLERKPEAKPHPKHELPKGAKLERQIQVTVLPSIPTEGKKIPGSGNLPETPDSSIASNSVQSVSNSGQSGAITVDLSLVKMPDGTERVIASSPNGAASGGLDIPVGTPAPIVRMPKWQAGILYGPSEHTYGAFVTRAAGPFVIGAQLIQERMPVQVGGGTTVKGMIAVGIRW